MNCLSYCSKLFQHLFKKSIVFYLNEMKIIRTNIEYNIPLLFTECDKMMLSEMIINHDYYLHPRKDVNYTYIIKLL
ncbi:hypothetical protein FHS70_001418 [Flammeovirga yaeyamensis]|nr:hypothetical protein [Flammeovirga yaeyamensis]